MDVAPGTEHVQVSLGSDDRMNSTAVLLTAALFLASYAFAPRQACAAIEPGQPVHYSADRQVWDRKSNRVELFGNVRLTQAGESLTSDYAVLDQNARTIDAKGNCVYVATDVTMYGEAMHFSLETRTGLILMGRVTTPGFTLSGARIIRAGEGRFQTNEGEYSTCHDCPNSWSMQAGDVDMEVEGYGFLKDVVAKVKDAPVFWTPYLVIPLKTKRQSGLLFPTLGYASQNGFKFVPRYFWATSRSTDMTFGLGVFTNQGVRGEWEGRYQLSDRSGGQANVYYLRDSEFYHSDPEKLKTRNRWSLSGTAAQDLPWNVEAKLTLLDVSDGAYLQQVSRHSADIGVNLEKDLTSSLTFAKSEESYSAALEFERHRNVLYTDPTGRITEFDPNTVQVLPRASLITNDRRIFSKYLTGGFSLGVSNFIRSAAPFDDLATSEDEDNSVARPGVYDRGVDPLREAIRISATPRLYSTFRPFDVLSLIPSAEYRSYFYSFSGAEGVGSLTRGYLLYQTELSTQLERIYEDPQDPEIPSVKHLIRPVLRWSYIPSQLVREDTRHPFIGQIRNSQNGVTQDQVQYAFDSYDIVPRGTAPSISTDIVPLGNSITYGASTQWIRKRMSGGVPSYQKYIEVSSGQTINLEEVGKDNGEPFARFFTNAGFSFDRIGLGVNYSYYPFASREAIKGTDEAAQRRPFSKSTVSINGSYTIESGLRQGILDFQRSFGLSYNYNMLTTEVSDVVGSVVYSINDYVMPSASVKYRLYEQALDETKTSLSFQSPSRCWKFTTTLKTNPVTVAQADGTTRLERNYGFAFDLTFNFIGTGFGDLKSFANQTVTGGAL